MGTVKDGATFCSDTRFWRKEWGRIGAVMGRGLSPDAHGGLQLLTPNLCLLFPELLAAKKTHTCE